MNKFNLVGYALRTLSSMVASFPAPMGEGTSDPVIPCVSLVQDTAAACTSNVTSPECTTTIGECMPIPQPV